MYTLQLDISKSIVSYDDWFSYTLYLSDDASNIVNEPFTMQFSLPSYLEYYLPTLEGFYISTTTNQDDDTLISISFDNSLIHSSLTSYITFKFSCRYLPFAPKYTSFHLEPILYNNKSYIADAVTLSSNPDFTLSLYLHSPSYLSPHIGGKIIYRGVIQNIGEKDYTPKDISLTLNLRKNRFLSLDNSFLIFGHELSNINKFTTTITLLEEHTGFILDISNYSGDYYEFFFATNITFASFKWNTIDLSLPWEIDNVPMPTAHSICKIDMDLEYIHHYATDYLSMLDLNYYYSYFLNSIGNTPSLYTEIKLDISAYSYKLKNIITGVYSLTSGYNPIDISYTISYSLKSSPDTRLSLSDSSKLSTASSYIISNLPDDFIDSIYINFDIIPMGMYTISPLVLVFDLKNKLYPDTVFKPNGFLITNSSYLVPLKSYLESFGDIYPPLITHTNYGHSPTNLYITSRINIASDNLRNLIYYTFIPKGFDASNSRSIFSFEYNHHFIPTSNLPSITEPTITTAYDTYLGTLYQIDFGSIIFPAGSELTVTISLLMSCNISGEFNHYCLISSPSITTFDSNYNDTQDILLSSSFHKKFNTSLPLICSPPITVIINNISAVSSNFQIKHNNFDSYKDTNSNLDIVSNCTIIARLILENHSYIDISDIDIHSNLYDSHLNHPHLAYIVQAGILYNDSLNLLDSTSNINLISNNHFSLGNIVVPAHTKLILLLQIILPHHNSYHINIHNSLDMTLNLKQYYSISNYKSPSAKLTYIPNTSYINLIGSVHSSHSLQHSLNITNNILIILYKYINDSPVPWGIYITQSNQTEAGYAGFHLLTPGVYSLRILGKNIGISKVQISSLNMQITCTIDNNGFTSLFSITETNSTYDIYIEVYKFSNSQIIYKLSDSTRLLIKECLYHQLSLNMTYEDIMTLITYKNL